MPLVLALIVSSCLAITSAGLIEEVVANEADVHREAVRLQAEETAEGAANIAAAVVANQDAAGTFAVGAGLADPAGTWSASKTAGDEWTLAGQDVEPLYRVVVRFEIRLDPDAGGPTWQRVPGSWSIAPG